VLLYLPRKLGVFGAEKYLNEIPVLLDNPGLAFLSQNLAAEDHQHMTRQPLPQGKHGVIVRGEADLVVEREIRPVDCRPVATPDRLFHVGDRGVEAMEKLWFRSIGCNRTAHCNRLKRCPYLADLVDSHGVEFDDAHAPVRFALDDALCFQRLQRFAQRDTADHELACKIKLNEALARIQRARPEPFDYGVRDLVRQATRLDERQARGRHLAALQQRLSFHPHHRHAGPRTPVLLDCIQSYLRLATLSRKMPPARVGAKCGERETMWLRTVKLVACAVLAASLIHAGMARAADTTVPPPGQSKKIDEIKKRGTLRAAAIGEFPWLPENTSGNGPKFSGPAWVLANEIATRLGVTLEIVPVSHETKVPILATGQADITIAPLSITPARQKVVDFVPYSGSSLCFFGLASNRSEEHV